MKFRNAAAAVAALTLVATPAIAQAAQTSALTIDRIGASSDSESDLAGSNILIGVIVAAAIIGAIIVVADDNDDEPVSP